MQELKYRVILRNTGEIIECDAFKPIWGVLGYHINDNPHIEIHISGVHVSTIATAPNGRTYYRRMNSLKQFDITELFSRY